MKVKIDGTQEEFDAKRADLIKAIAGSQYDVVLKKKDERSVEDEGEPYFKAQADMLVFWDERFKATLKTIREELDEIIG